VIRRLAEDSNAWQPLGPGETRIETDRFVLWLGRGQEPGWTVAQRLRLRADDVAATVDEVRGLVVARGRRACQWEVSSSATPADLGERLGAFGIVPDREPLAVGMVLTEPPPAGPGDVAVRLAETSEDLLVHRRIAWTAFGMEGDPSEPAPPPSPHGASYLAEIDGVPVAAASATFTEWGAVMNGGSTLPEARGRGAYRALVAARWADAVARGTPALVTQAGAMSRPILERLGFRGVAEIRIYLDEFGG
jgi:hypothetical protein